MTARTGKGAALAPQRDLETTGAREEGLAVEMMLAST
jgi:hypothetical protein